jgi:hypothetical protein
MSERNKKMQLRRNAATIGTYFILILLGMALVISASKNETTKIIDSDSVITQEIQQHVAQRRVIEMCEAQEFFANDVLVSEAFVWCWFIMFWSPDLKRGLAMHVHAITVQQPFEKGFYTHYGGRDASGPCVVTGELGEEKKEMVHQPLGEALDFWLSTFEGKNQEMEIFIYRRDPQDVGKPRDTEFAPFYEDLVKKVRDKFEFQNCYFIGGLISCKICWNIKCHFDENGTLSLETWGGH